MAGSTRLAVVGGLAAALATGFSIGKMVDFPQAYAQATDNASSTCVLRNIQKIQNVHSQANWSPLAWLVAECSRNPGL